jgi:hypothetical protein
MSTYIEFLNADGSHTLVEVDETEVVPEPGESVKAGLVDDLRARLASAGTTLQKALGAAIKTNAQAILLATRELSEAPSEVEVVFALKATGDLGNIAICKAGGESNYSVKLTWRAKP